MAVAPGRITYRNVKRCLDAGDTAIIGFDTEYEAATNEDVELPDQRPGNRVLCLSFAVADPTDFENRVSGIIYMQGPTKKHRLDFNGFLSRVIQCAIAAGLLTEHPEHPGAPPALLLAPEGAARKDGLHQPPQCLPRQHHGGGEPLRHDRHARAVRPAPARLRPCRLPALVRRGRRSLAGGA